MAKINNTAFGTLAEGDVHRRLKELIEPREQYREVEYLGYIADIKNENGITEIQTRSYAKLVPKLKLFLENDAVTVVTPVVKNKLTYTLIDGGELIGPRKSPKHQKAEHLCRELYEIRDLVGEKFTVKLVFISATETRLKKKARRGKIISRTLDEIYGETVLKSRDDYAAIFLPQTLSTEFLAKDYAKALGVEPRIAYYGIKLMQALGYVTKTGKTGRAYIYKIQKRGNKNVASSR